MYKINPDSQEYFIMDGEPARERQREIERERDRERDTHRET